MSILDFASEVLKGMPWYVYVIAILGWLFLLLDLIKRRR